jgi:hypothetical protein
LKREADETAALSTFGGGSVSNLVPACTAAILTNRSS